MANDMRLWRNIISCCVVWLLHSRYFAYGSETEERGMPGLGELQSEMVTVALDGGHVVPKCLP